MRPRGLRVEIDWRHRYLEEAVHVFHGARDTPSWLVFPAVDGGFGVAPFPGPAEIVPTLEAALAMVTVGVDRTDH
jgi:hypothetical protein